MNKRKVLSITIILILLLVLTGCAVPKDANGNEILISMDTGWKEVFKQEGWFGAFLVFPLTKICGFVIEHTNNVFLGIAAITILINIILYIVTLNSQLAPLRVQKLEPIIEKIKRDNLMAEHPKNDLQITAEIESLYRKNKISPMGVALLPFAQLPVMFAMYHAVKRCYDVVNGQFLGMWMAVPPLIAIQQGEIKYGVLWGTMVLLQIFSSALPNIIINNKLKKRAKKYNIEYKRMKTRFNPMIIFSMMFNFLAIAWPTAMSLYWITTSIISIVKTIVMDKVRDKVIIETWNERKINEQLYNPVVEEPLVSDEFAKTEETVIDSEELQNPQ